MAARTSILRGMPLIMEYEALAILEAVSWAIKLGFQHVIFESDVQQVVKAFNSFNEDGT